MVFIILFIHIIVCILIFIQKKCGHIHTRTVAYQIAYLIPFWGPILFIVEERACRKNSVSKEVGLDSLKIMDERYKRIKVVANRNEDITVPLEEAMVINDSQVRRRLMMDVLQNEPQDNVSLLLAARVSDDTDIAHFATTTMMQIQSKYEADIQEIQALLEETPDDVNLLRKYRKVLMDYLNSGLLSGNVMDVYRNLVGEVIIKLVDKEPGNPNYIYDFIEDRIAIGENADLESWIELLEQYYGENEMTYRVCVDYYYSCHQGEKIKQLLDRIERENVYLTSEGKKWYRFWRGKVS